MSRKVILSIIFVCLNSLAACGNVVEKNKGMECIPTRKSKSSNLNSLYPVRLNGLWGFINSIGEIVAEPKFVAVGTQSEGKIPIQISNKKWGVINLNGEIIIEPKFDHIGEFYQGLASVKIGNYWNVISEDGRLILKENIPIPFNFSDERAFIKVAHGWKIIDLQGHQISNLIFQEHSNYVEGFASVKFKNQGHIKTALIDKHGNLTFISQDFEISTDIDFSDGLIPISMVKEFSTNSDSRIIRRKGYINKYGEIKIYPTFEGVSNFKNCFSGYIENFKWGVINLYGDKITPAKYDFIQGFEENFSVVVLDGKYGFINQLGFEIVPPTFHAANSFSEGLAAVQVSEGKNKTWGFIDYSGKIVINPKFDKVGAFKNGISQVEINGKQIYINKSGEYIWSSD